MKKTCQKCGASLQENDFLCPKCGAIYGEPVYETPKAVEKSTPAAQKRGGRFVLFCGIALLIIVASLLLWDPFRPAATMPSTSHTRPTTSALPTPPPTTLPPTVPTTVPPTTLPFNQKQFEWTMHGTWIQNGQATQNTVAFTITGAIPIKADPGGPVQNLSLSTSWPDGFTYANQNETLFSCNAYPSNDTEASAIFVMFGSAYNMETKLPILMVIYLCPEKEYVVVQWRDNEDLYLAASTDANADTDAILAHFHGFINTNQ